MFWRALFAFVALPGMVAIALPATWAALRGRPLAHASGFAVLALGLVLLGGAVPLDSRFYIVREADAVFKTAITRRDSIVLVKGARQMGKTSLLARGLQQAREAGARVAFTDWSAVKVATA